MRFLLALCLTFSPLAASSQDDRLDELTLEYVANIKRTIVAVQDDPSNSIMHVLLIDGTFWECPYTSTKEQQFALQNWVNGTNVFIFPTRTGLKLAGDFSPFFQLPATLDSATLDGFPSIQSIKANIVTLTDGSSWKETSKIYSASKYWEVGDRILVSFIDDITLINIDQSAAGILSTYYMPGIMTDWAGH